MAGATVVLGETGENVRANVKRLRRGMPYSVMSRRLEAAGRRIPPLGLRRIEAGKRKVDVDDLMALAAVLHVPPSALLRPAEDMTRWGLHA